MHKKEVCASRLDYGYASGVTIIRLILNSAKSGLLCVSDL